MIILKLINKNKGAIKMTYRYNPEYVRKLIKLARKRTYDIEKLLDTTQTSTNRRLSGAVEFSISEAIKLSEFLGMEIKDIFCPTDEQLLKILDAKIPSKQA
jgi:hypothetical protein